MAKWSIIIPQGATFEQTITIAGVSDIGTATLWRLIARLAGADSELFEATTDNGLLLAGDTSAQKRLVLPAADTLLYTTGNGLFDFEVEWAGGIVRRYYSAGQLQVNAKANS